MLEREGYISQTTGSNNSHGPLAPNPRPLDGDFAGLGIPAVDDDPLAWKADVRLPAARVRLERLIRVQSTAGTVPLAEAAAVSVQALCGAVTAVQSVLLVAFSHRVQELWEQALEG
jgi:hypothetical protein